MLFRTGVQKVCFFIQHGLAVILLSAVLTSCSSDNEREPVNGEIKINLTASKDINPNENGHPAPLKIFVYSVRDMDVFNNVDFFEIFDGNSKPVQEATSKDYEAILQPGESRVIFLKPDRDVNGLGFIGAYRDLNDAVWSDSWVFPVRKKSWWWSRFFSDDSIELSVDFQKTKITINKMD